jgi:hypothetical protein
MNRVLLTGLALASLTFSLDSATAQQRDRANAALANGWELNYEAGLETARRTGKPLMVVFRCVP